MKKSMVYKTWAVNILCYKKHIEAGKIDLELRRESFSDWCEVLVENHNITELEAENFKNNLTDEELRSY
jgi:hypothetical protein